MKHKRYLILGWMVYYPSGGMNNVIDSLDDLEKAIIFVNENDEHDCYCIYDRLIGETIFYKNNED